MEAQVANPKLNCKQTPKVFTSDAFQVLLKILLGDGRPLFHVEGLSQQ